MAIQTDGKSSNAAFGSWILGPSVGRVIIGVVIARR